MIFCMDCGKELSVDLLGDWLNRTQKHLDKSDKNFLCLNEQHFLLELDDLIAHEIYTLNQKGFQTRSCCSGHNREDSPGGFVVVDLPNSLTSLPEGWSRKLIHEVGESKTVKFEYQFLPGEDKSKKISQMMISLDTWINSLG